MDKRTVEILLEQGAGGFDRVLTYSLPVDLADGIKPGVRVVVPLGNREAAGIVMDLDVPAPPVRLKEVRRILDPQPLVDAVRARLADWMAERYLVRRCDSWRLFLPPGVRRTGARRLVQAVSEGELRRRLERFILLPEESDRLAEELARLKGSGRSAEHLRRILGPLYQQVETLLAEGYLAWREPWQRRRPQAQTAAHVVLTANQPDKPTPKQAKVLAYLAARPNGSAAEVEILAACGVGRGVIDRLAAGGFVRVERRPDWRVPIERTAELAEEKFALYPAQTEAVAWVRDHLASGGAMLLHGVTGSGKTEVYLQALALALAAGGGGYLLVPEIGLTPQTVERVVARFGDRVAVLHSRLSLGERWDEWERIRTGDARVVVGPRSALFAPLGRPRLIILDEEHDQAYKQEDGVRYHAREVAAEYCRLTGSVLILGSATPSLETMAACERGEMDYLSLPERPGGRPLPAVELVDMRGVRDGRRSSLSPRLRDALAECLTAKEQAILLLNRRGYATFVICRECGHSLRCPHCEVALTYHQGQINLLCHYCGYTQTTPNVCPRCAGRRIGYFGLGTERLCEEVSTLFPEAKVARMDQDTTAGKGAHHHLYQALRAGEIDILIGTQMVAKGLDLPRVTLVGVVAADASLNRPDFRAAERTFQLLAQVAGRAGRGDIPGRVLLQTYNPDHYSLVCASRHDYLDFHRQERALRLAAAYPPFAEMARIGFTGRNETATIRAAEELARRLRKILVAEESTQVLGPTSALVRRVQDRYRYHLLVKTSALKTIGVDLLNVINEFRQDRRNAEIKVIIDVNPNTVL